MVCEPQAQQSSLITSCSAHLDPVPKLLTIRELCSTPFCLALRLGWSAEPHLHPQPTCSPSPHAQGFHTIRISFRVYKSPSFRSFHQFYPQSEMDSSPPQVLTSFPPCLPLFIIHVSPVPKSTSGMLSHMRFLFLQVKAQVLAISHSSSQNGCLVISANRVNK